MPAALDALLAGPLQKVRAANATDTSFAARVPTVTEPTGAGVLALTPASGFAEVPAWLLLVPFGTGDADDAFDVRVVGWKRVATLWVPLPLLQFTATLGTATGVAGAAVTDAELFADTVSAPASGFGTSGTDCFPYSPVSNLVASYRLYTRGCQKVEVLFDATTGSPTGMNALWCAL